MFREVPNYWDTEDYRKNAEDNLKYVKNTIDDLKFKFTKVVVCGRGTSTHPNFTPLFSTPTSNIESTLYVTVDHSPAYTRFLTRKGDYALSLIVHPKVREKLESMNCNIFWFSPEYLENSLPKINFGKNSGLAGISLAAYFKMKYILLSGINLTGQYEQFLEHSKIIFEEIEKQGIKIFSLTGNLSKNISFEEWCKL
jgi:hypothetical protein